MKLIIWGAVVIALASGSARADEFAYAITGPYDYVSGAYGAEPSFGVVDLTTGGFTATSVLGSAMNGLGVGSGGTLYTTNGQTLYTINPTTGALSAVGNTPIVIFDMGSTTSGLFAVGTDMNLYSINPTTAAATLIGATGLAYFNGLSTGSNTLYLTNGSTLYTVNTATGAATLVGSSSSGIFGAEVVENGTLYAGSATPLALYSLNGSNGDGTFLTDVSGTRSNFWGLAPDAVTPLPAALPLFATGLGGLGLLGWRRKRKAQGAAADKTQRCRNHSSVGRLQQCPR
jgi:hypothetical protein